MNLYVIALYLTILGGLVPSTIFLVVARKLLRTKRDRALGIVLWAMPFVIWLLYVRALLSLLLGGVITIQPLRVAAVSIGLGGAINFILCGLLIVFLRRRRVGPIDPIINEQAVNGGDDGHDLSLR